MSPLPESLDWSTAPVAPRHRFARWQEAVSATHLPWDIPSRRRVAPYAATLRAHHGAALRIIECRCDPCAGRRGRHELSRSDDAWFGVLHVIEGRERVRQAGREIDLGPGDLLLWDSTRPIDFAIGQALRKVTLLLPQRQVVAIVPDAHDRVGQPVSGVHGPGAVFASHVRMLATEYSGVPAAQRATLEAATFDLLSVAWSSVRPAAGEDPLEHLKAAILSQLGDPDLSPARVAAQQGLSLRQLHRIFEAAETTVSRWIWQQRLERCRADLRTHPHLPILAIAFRWGFSDAAHFSRAFRQRFGVSARDWRRGPSVPAEVLDPGPGRRYDQ